MFVPRCNQKEIFKSFESTFVTTVLGPRRVGKSTLVQHYAQEHPEKKWLHLNMDLMAERQRIEAHQLEPLLEERAQRKIASAETLWVTVDEAQKCPALFEQIKVLYDLWKESPALKFILTGSGFLSLHQLAAETLAGRIEIFYLREFSLREGARLQGISLPEMSSFWNACEAEEPVPRIQEAIQAIAPWKPQLEAALEEQMVWGGLPELLQSQDREARIRYLENYLQTYLEKDIRDLATITDLPLYQRMMEVIAQQTGSVRDDARLLQSLGCSRDTLKKYRGFLEATLVYQEIYPFIGSSLKRLVKSPKGYLTNNGLISYLTGIFDPNALKKTGAMGHRFENWVLKEIQVWLDGDPRRSEIFFWRTTGNVEVDLVVNKPPRVFPFEVTYSSQIERRKVKHLRQFLKEEAGAPYGFYLYNGDFRFDEDARILFLPAWAMG